MKKIIVAILALLYITASTGAMLHLHYCMGKLAGWGISYNESASCGECGMKQSAKKDKSCCDHNQKFVKYTVDQKTIETDFQMNRVMDIAPPVSFFAIPSSFSTIIADENSISHAPPRNGGVAVYIRNCVFRI